MYDGWCRACEERFEQGDEIVSAGGGYIHAECQVELGKS
jgi:hypothetical protein